MIELCVQEVARSRGWNLSRLQRSADLPMTSARRLWHSSKTGLERDRGTLEDVKLSYLARIANVLGVEPAELFTRQNT